MIKVPARQLAQVSGPIQLMRSLDQTRPLALQIQYIHHLQSPAYAERWPVGLSEGYDNSIAEVGMSCMQSCSIEGAGCQ